MATVEQVLKRQVLAFLTSIRINLNRSQLAAMDRELDGWIGALKNPVAVDNPLVSYMRRSINGRNVRVTGTGFTSGKALVQYEDTDEVAYVRTEDMRSTV